MPGGLHKTVKDRIAATAAAAAAATQQSETQASTPEPPTVPANASENGPLATSSGGPRSTRQSSHGHVSRSTEGWEWYTADRHQKRTHGERSVRGRKRKAAQRARSGSRRSNGGGTDAQTDVDNPPAQTDNDTQAEPSAPRGRSSKRKKVTVSKPKPRAPPENRRKRGRSASRSPTPGSTDADPAELDFVTGNTPAGSQYTYVYETVSHDALLRIAETRLGENMEGRPTQEILNRLRVVEENQTPALAAKRRNTSIVLLSPAPIAVGGGWRHERLHASASAMASSNHNPGPASKRARTTPAQDNTDTVSESDEAPASTSKAGASKPTHQVNRDAEPERDDQVPSHPRAPPTVSRVSSARPSYPLRPSPLPLQYPPSPDNPVPPPSRDPTPATVHQAQPSGQPSRSHSLGGSLSHYGDPPVSPTPVQPSRSHSLGGSLSHYGDSPVSPAPVQPSRSHSLGGSLSHYGDPLPPLPRLSTPIRGPTHARLKAKVLERFLDRVEVLEEAEEGNQANKPDKPQKPGTSNPSQQPPRPPRQTQRTYGGTRSHLPSDLNSLREATAPPPRPNSPSNSVDSMLNRERARAAMEEVDEMEAAREEFDARSRIPPSHRAINVRSYIPPVYYTDGRLQQHIPPRVARSLIGAATHPVEPAPPRRPREKPNRRVDPINAAREDMAAFNEEVAQGNVESFVQSVVHQGRRLENERINGCGPIRRRSLADLLEDDEELVAELEALMNGKRLSRLVCTGLDK
ncbi:hypothetical protein FRC12_022573 [Ceratobasidium sp. 428]|nr:hypothetical protein FRC12_022573 [Ceratobasidium sp. 428]